MEKKKLFCLCQKGHSQSFFSSCFLKLKIAHGCIPILKKVLFLLESGGNDVCEIISSDPAQQVIHYFYIANSRALLSHTLLAMSPQVAESSHTQSQRGCQAEDDLGPKLITQVVLADRGKNGFSLSKDWLSGACSWQQCPVSFARLLPKERNGQPPVGVPIWFSIFCSTPEQSGFFLLNFIILHKTADFCEDLQQVRDTTWGINSPRKGFGAFQLTTFLHLLQRSANIKTLQEYGFWPPPGPDEWPQELRGFRGGGVSKGTSEITINGSQL
ncbi:hypothetical protein GWK47_015294 [Chionoecetes opilio]|uniref:Uncharacterized protein n=1 Tax=Chionoecetes opilio TaxID=41210 RepID=A0A8J4Y331_CHIOP|nr:hypothetical protein GWK47_015294 [Chionoecetes opilio]